MGSEGVDGDDPLIGRTLAGKFAIEAKLGEGAMGRVYRAKQLALDKTVAIKVLHRDLAADATFVERFRREARAASRLDHPHSMHVYDFGEEPDGLLYLAMEFVEGRDLMSLIGEAGGVPPPRVVDILSQVLGALAVAHEMGVLHRDLKPENIMIVRGKGDDGQPTDVVKVCDFGIAKILEPANGPPSGSPGKHTTAGMVVGTPAYMSPEQARGQALDGRSDLYSVGVILYELLTGRLPFDADTAIDIVFKHIREAPVRPSQFANVDERLEAVCMKALEKQPVDRFQHAREMRQALRAAIDGLSEPRLILVPSSGGSPAGHARSETPTLDAASLQPAAVPRRSRSWVWLAVSTVVVAAGAASLGLHWRSRVPAADPVAALAPKPATTVEAVAPFLGSDAPAASHAPVKPPMGASLLAGRADSSRPIARERKARSDGLDPSVLPAAPLPAASPTPQPAVADGTPAASPGTGSTREAPSIAPPLAAVLPSSTPPEPASPPVSPFDLTRARVEIGQATNAVGATSSSIARTVADASAQLTSCYRQELPKMTGAIEGRGTLHVETDGAGVITDTRVTGPTDAAMANCVGSAVRGRRIPNVDTGNASADILLLFRAH